MNVRRSKASVNTIDRCTTYGLFGGAALGSVVGVLVSGPNFFVWSLVQSVGVILGLAVGIALIGYLFGLVVGGLAGGGALAEEQGEMSGSEGGGGD